MAEYQRGLTADFVREILDYDPETGIFRWKHRKDRARRWNSRWVGKIAGYPIKGHIRIQVNGKPGYYANQLAWLHYYGVWPEYQVDHRDTVRGNNRIDNLREATHAQNMQNRAGAQSNSRTGVLGVSPHGKTGRWRARINVDGVRHELGYFDTIEEAKAARDEAARAIHGDFAKTNP